MRHHSNILQIVTSSDQVFVNDANVLPAKSVKLVPEHCDGKRGRDHLTF